jgi:ribosome-binding protein aMBF1 (putative translation factor)
MSRLDEETANIVHPIVDGPELNFPVPRHPRRRRPDITSPDLGLIVRVERESKGWSQAALAQRTGMRIAQLSALENGHNCEIRFYEVCAVALGFSNAAELFAETSADRERLRRQLRAQVLREVAKLLR